MKKNLLAVVMVLLAFPVMAQKKQPPAFIFGGGSTTISTLDSVKMLSVEAARLAYLPVKSIRGILDTTKIPVNTMMRVDSVLWAAKFVKNADTTTVKNTILAQTRLDIHDSISAVAIGISGLATGHTAYLSAAAEMSSGPHNRYPATADSGAVKSDIPPADFSWTLDSSYVSTTDTVAVALPRYTIEIDSVGVWLIAGAPKDLDVKIMFSAPNPQSSWTNITDTVTVTAVNGITWISGANLLEGTLTGNQLVAAVFTETTSKPKLVIISVVGRRKDANGSSYPTTTY